jgi:hypothetical protein
VIVPKSALAFPQVWLGGEKKWRHADKEGVFVQLEARKDRGVWFIPITRTPEGHIKAGDEVPRPFIEWSIIILTHAMVQESLDIDVFGLVPRLYPQ